MRNDKGKGEGGGGSIVRRRIWWHVESSVGCSVRSSGSPTEGSRDLYTFHKLATHSPKDNQKSNACDESEASLHRKSLHDNYEHHRHSNACKSFLECTGCPSQQNILTNIEVMQRERRRSTSKQDCRSTKRRQMQCKLK
jgi:hypothetical protein